MLAVNPRVRGKSERTSLREDITTAQRCWTLGPTSCFEFNAGGHIPSPVSFHQCPFVRQCSKIAPHCDSNQNRCPLSRGNAINPTGKLTYVNACRYVKPQPEKSKLESRKSERASPNIPGPARIVCTLHGRQRERTPGTWGGRERSKKSPSGLPAVLGEKTVGVCTP
jgi:hypothetical protein